MTNAAVAPGTPSRRSCASRALATLPFGLGVSAAAQLVALIAVLALMLAVEETQARRELALDRVA